MEEDCSRDVEDKKHYRRRSIHGTGRYLQIQKYREEGRGCIARWRGKPKSQIESLYIEHMKTHPSWDPPDGERVFVKEDRIFTFMAELNIDDTFQDNNARARAIVDAISAL